MWRRIRLLLGMPRGVVMDVCNRYRLACRRPAFRNPTAVRVLGLPESRPPSTKVVTTVATRATGASAVSPYLPAIDRAARLIPTSKRSQKVVSSAITHYFRAIAA